MKHKSIIVYLILFLLIGIASIFILHHEKKITINTLSQNTIDTFIHKATFTEYDKQGLVKTKVYSNKVVHYQVKNSIVFEKPFITSYAENRTPWHIRADQATSDNTGDKIILNGHVVAHELSARGQAGTVVKTSALTVFPKLSQLETDQPVTLTRPGIMIYGVGFTANLKTGQYQLHSQSKVIYQPSKKSKSR